MRLFDLYMLVAGYLNRGKLYLKLVNMSSCSQPEGGKNQKIMAVLCFNGKQKVFSNCVTWNRY